MNDKEKFLFSMINSDILISMLDKDDRENIITYFKEYGTKEDLEIVKDTIEKFKTIKYNRAIAPMIKKYAKGIIPINIDLTQFTKPFLLMFFKLSLFYNPDIIERIEQL